MILARVVNVMRTARQYIEKHMILHFPPDTPLVLRAAADTILFLHIAGGSVGILSGAVALVARKGETLHRIAGTVFFVSILIMSGIGFLVSPFLPSATNTIAGLFTFYLVATAWLTVRRKEGTIGRLEKAAILVPVIASAAGVTFIILAKNRPTGTIEDTPIFYVFLLLGTIATLSDLKVIVRGGISGAPRIARHLWRMCTALTIASGSFFLGQQQVMPVFVRGSPWMFVPVLAPIVLLFFWLLRVRLTNWFTRDAIASQVPG